MLCGRCGEQNPAINRFCQGCGLPLPIACPSCSHVNPAVAAFCGSCGSSLQPVSRPARSSGVSPGILHGEFKQVTVLFADLVSSTELVARLDPEEAMQRLKPALDTMCEAVERFEGTVVRTLGDGILAFFGAPRAQEGHALLACEAALAIRDAPMLRREAMAVRIGLHSGPIVADARSADKASDNGAYGVTIHLASRLPPKVEPGGICLTEETYRLARAFCDADRLGRHRLRGMPEPVELFLLKGLKPAVASQQFRGVALTSFLGRDREMTLLQRTLTAVETGTSRVTGIVGAPGTGKSRLCYEFAEWCRGRLIPVLEARAQPYGAATPLQPVLEFLRLNYFNVKPDDDTEQAAQRIAECLTELGSTFEADLPLVCDFLGIKYGQDSRARLNPKARNVRLLDIVRHLIRQRGVNASVIIIEDLHWLDQASEEFVATLVEAVATTKTCLVVNCRPAYSAPWMRSANYQQIELAELNSTDTDLLVDELVGRRPELAEIRERIVERSGGNPFFAEELIRSLKERLALVGEEGDFRRGIVSSLDVLPSTVQAVIGARIDRLLEPERDLLQTAAIIGKEFQFKVLQQVAGQEAAEVQDLLVRLYSTGLLQFVNGPDGRSYSFRHPLIQEVAYSMQLRSRRGHVHAAVGRAIEQFYPERLNEFAALLSYHFEEAQEIEHAAEYAARAARWVGSTSPAQAIKHWHKVRSLCAGRPRTAENDSLRILASGQIAWLGWREGMTWEEAGPFVREALDWARDTDHSMIPLLLAVQGRISGASGGQADAYVSIVKEALALMKSRNDPGRAATLNASLSQAYGWAGLLREALATNDLALADVPSVADFDHQFLGYSTEHWLLSLRGRILLRLGQFDEARLCFDQMLALEPGQIDPTVQFIAHFGYVDLAWCFDDSTMAAEHAGRVADLAARQGSPYLRTYAYACNGMAHSIAGKHEAAIEDYSQGIKYLREARVAMEIEPELLASLADSQYRAGLLQAAVDTAQQAVSIARDRSARLARCRASITLAMALTASRCSDAEHRATQLLEDAEQLIAASGASIYARLLEEARTRTISVCSRSP